MASEERFKGSNIVDAGSLSPYWGEHTARYAFALPYVEERSVFDIACGTGYGISLMANKAEIVVGGDVDILAAIQAKKECAENARILLANGLHLPFYDGSFDVITSFETLEHIDERSAFLSELSRVLKSDGHLILSTPNANYTKPVNGKPTNPFHVFEYTPQELLAELELVFSVESFLGQSLDDSIRIPPFQDAQRRLPNDLLTQSTLFCWKVFNKLPFIVRESLSKAIWRKPFYPTATDYTFLAEQTNSAPVLVAVCRKKADK